MVEYAEKLHQDNNKFCAALRYDVSWCSNKPKANKNT